MPFFTYHIAEGKPIQNGPVTIIPKTRVLALAFKPVRNGFVWNRPDTVEIQVNGETIREVPVPDTTRKIQVLILLAGLLGGILIWLLAKRDV